MRPAVVLAGGDGWLRAQLGAERWRVTVAATVQRGAELAAGLGAALLIVGGGEGCGIPRVLSVLRSRDPRAPTRIVVVRRSGDLEALACLRAGADEHIRLPCHSALLRLRLERLAGAGSAATEPSVRCGPLTLDIRGRHVTLAGRRVEVPRREFELLRCLISEPERVFTREEILTRAWGYSGAGLSTRTLDSHASRLRRRLGTPGGPWITNVWGVGYRLR